MMYVNIFKKIQDIFQSYYLRHYHKLIKKNYKLIDTTNSFC